MSSSARDAAEGGVVSDLQSQAWTAGDFANWSHTNGYREFLVVRKARATYQCAGCRATIERSALHGSSPNVPLHVCILCIEPSAGAMKGD